MKKKIMYGLLSLLVLVVALFLWTATGIAQAVGAQTDISRNGLYYEGEIWLTPSAHQELKGDLDLRNTSLHTSADLVVIPEIKDGKILVRYSFFSSEKYPYLKTAPFPESCELGFTLIPPIGTASYWGIVITTMLFVFKKGQLVKPQDNSEE